MTPDKECGCPYLFGYSIFLSTLNRVSFLLPDSYIRLLLRMDVFNLPDVFLRMVMKRITMKDRLSLRLTCRSFEKLVAATHAGYFSNGYINIFKKSFSVRIGDTLLNDFTLNKNGMERLIYLRKLLFNGISIEQFEIDMDYILTLDYLRQFTHNMIIDQLSLVLKVDSEFEKSMQLISSFPKSKHTLSLGYAPDTAKILSLPPLAMLDMRHERNPLSNELFFHLLAVHKSLHLCKVHMTVHDIVETLLIISADFRARSLEICSDCSTIACWLNGFGVSKESEFSESFGQLEIREICEKQKFILLFLRMDFSALPDVFLRELMKAISIKDRLNLRLTCSNIENLVACTHAGHFAYGYIIHGLLESTFSVRIGNILLKDFELNEKGVNKFVFVRRQLFTGISIGQFEINVCYRGGNSMFIDSRTVINSTFEMDDYNLTLEYLLAITWGMTIDVLGLVLNYDSEFDKCMQLMAEFPRSEHTLSLGYALDTSKLLSLPPLTMLDLRCERNPIPNYLFFYLLVAHTSLYLHTVEMTIDDFVNTLQIVSSDSRLRSLQFSSDSFTISCWLNIFGITENSKAKEASGEFEILEIAKKQEIIRLRIRRCLINLLHFEWNGEQKRVHVYVTKIASQPN
ncbi:hypothetical protein PRIPAC_78127 [Pristionchus pacificus]|uniref:F-box domain-containing protein n=1 Tax=Pristionchus pacificus TaxID=54126 RepID=A0A2A6CLE8_PRIPA|nr:hypothetical protein PRIPAC_78127 [Pristionchus pacificus]|eukprot:PDM78908.1 F-box domain-containing protein [Pristionchus pacificus]